MYPGGPVSSSTSEARARPRNAAAPSVVPMSSVTLRLLVLKWSQCRLRPGPGLPSMKGPISRMGSPPGGSTLMTSAPMSAINLPQ